ncbi:MAG TPA: DNA repair protein RecN [Gemmatimonadales bacterium]|nr:DNA repair protein RecN [Gemmatimonadales bacterium]
MLAELRVRDVATIADVSLPLGPGLNVLTGETGAGKSILVDALGLLLGGRGDSGVVRPGAGRAVVEGAFEGLSRALTRRVEALGVDVDEGRIVIRREVSAEGRSRAWINGSPTTIGVLAELGGLLVDLHGQHETVSLLRPETQRDILDAYAQAGTERETVAAAHAALAELRAQEGGLTARLEEVRRRADYLKHVTDEIAAARLKPGEDEALAQEAKRLAHASSLEEQARILSEAIDGEDAGALRALTAAERALGQLERVDPEVTPWRELLDGAYAQLSEVARLAAAYADEIERDPARLESVERRRDLLFRLQQKHGGTLEAVLETHRAAAAELELLDTADADLRALAARRRVAEEAAGAAAERLTEKRKDAAGRLARAVGRLLPKLGLTGGRFEVVLVPLAQPGPDGAEAVQFTVRLNVGLDAQPIQKVASGGELSRLMLALEVVVAKHDRIPTFVFDEIDQGIGGEVGGQVGQALADVASEHQVLVITHLPQIAVRADRHLVVSKGVEGGVATSSVATILGEDRVTEIARMLGDPDGAAARRHAEEMLGRALKV